MSEEFIRLDDGPQFDKTGKLDVAAQEYRAHQREVCQVLRPGFADEDMSNLYVHLGKQPRWMNYIRHILWNANRSVAAAKDSLARQRAHCLRAGLVEGSNKQKREAHLAELCANELAIVQQAEAHREGVLIDLKFEEETFAVLKLQIRMPVMGSEFQEEEGEDDERSDPS